MKRIKQNKSLIIFAMCLAIILVVLKFSEYRYYIGSLDTDIYILIVASLFTVLGVWIGKLWLDRKKPKEYKIGEINEDELKSLNLSEREYEILKLISQGLSNKEISEQLFIAIPTVKTHTANLYSKLDVKSRTQAIYRAQQLSLI